jgi:hypothetical protein
MSESISNESISNDIRNRLQWSLLALRLGGVCCYVNVDHRQIC